jgi:molybdopterin-binding protein
MFIKTEKVCKSFSGKEVLRDISIELEEGKITSIIGPNGAGKTTLLRILNLLTKPTSGKLFFDNCELRKEALSIRRRMVMVLQNPIMFNCSVYNNVAYGLKIRGRRNPKFEIEEALSITGLSKIKNQSALTLSGGEVKRAALARALVLRPEVLFLDEPTADLDPLSKKIIENLIPTINREYGTTVIMALHDLLAGERLSNYLIMMVDGKIVQEGAPEEVLHRPNSSHAARFVGIENLFKGELFSRDGITELDIGEGVRMEVVTNLRGRVAASLRAEEVILSLRPFSSSARNSLCGTIKNIEDQGATSLISIDTGVIFQAIVTRRSKNEMGLVVGEKIFLTFKASSVNVFKEGDRG